MYMAKVARGLQTNIAAGVGRVIMHWAYQERMLALITFSLLDIGPKHGRVAARSPRVDDYITMIEQLMRLEKVSTTVDLVALRNNLKAAEKERDKYAHGIWIRHPKNNALMIQVLGGNWRPNPIEPKVSRRIKPEGEPVSMQRLTRLRKNIEPQKRMSVKRFGHADDGFSGRKADA